MIFHERQQKILDILNQKQSVTVGKLTKLLYSSEATIRRDLAFMEKKGLLLRVRGGATCINSAAQDKPLLLRNKVNKERKELIASIALRYITNGSSSFFDASSTISYFAKACAQKENLTIISNGIETMNILLELTDFKVICSGGTIKNSSSLLGSTAISTINNFRTDFCFFSCCGLSSNGDITEALEENSSIKLAMLSSAKTKIFLCDSSKFNSFLLRKTCDLSMIDIMISDQKPSDELISRFPNVEFVWE